MSGRYWIPDISWRTWRVWQRNRDTYKKFYKASLALNFGEPILYLMAMGLGIGGYIASIEGRPYLSFIAPGLIMSSAMFSACFECTWGTYARMQALKTYDAILATPVNLDEIVTGDILWGATKGLITGMLMLAVIVCFGIAESPWALLVPLLVILIGLLFASLSMIVSAVSPGWEYFNYFFTVVITPLFLFSGIFFPVSRLPEWAQSVAVYTPLLHAVRVSQGLVYGELTRGLLLDIAWLVCCAVPLFILAVNLMRRRFVQ